MRERVEGQSDCLSALSNTASCPGSQGGGKPVIVRVWTRWEPTAGATRTVSAVTAVAGIPGTWVRLGSTAQALSLSPGTGPCLLTWLHLPLGVCGLASGGHTYPMFRSSPNHFTRFLTLGKSLKLADAQLTCRDGLQLAPWAPYGHPRCLWEV